MSVATISTGTMSPELGGCGKHFSSPRGAAGAHQLRNDTAEPARVLATVLFTDIVGSTRLAAERGDARWQALLADHDVLALPFPEEHGGLGLDTYTYARLMEELAYGWMSLAGVLNTHMIAEKIACGRPFEAMPRTNCGPTP